MDSVSSGIYQSKEVKDHDRIPPSSTSLYVKKDSFPSFLDGKIDPPGVLMSGNGALTSSFLLDRKNEPSRAQMSSSEVFDSSWLLDGKNDEAHSGAYIDAELEKMRHMTPEEAMAFAAEAVKEAEVAVAEAEQAEREAREAEEVAREAEEAAQLLIAELKAKKKRKTSHDW